MTIKQLGTLFLLAAFWGASFLFIRVAAPVLGPFITVELRVLIAGVVLLVYGKFKKHKFSFRDKWRSYFAIGLLNAALPFALISAATIILDASMASILNSTTPFFGAIVAYFVLKEAFTKKKVLGLSLGIMGVTVLIGLSPLEMNLETLSATLMSLLASLSYAVGSTYTKKKFPDEDTLSLATGQQLFASLIMLPLCFINLPIEPMTTEVVVSMITLAILCTSVAYLMFFYLLREVGPTKTLSVTFLVPVFGTLWGYMFLNEQITPNKVLGLSIILLSIFILSDVKKKTKQLA